MLVKIKTLGSLEKFNKKNLSRLDVPEQTSIRELKSIIGIPENYPGNYVVNEKLVDLDYIVKPDDEIRFIMIIGGG